MQFLRLVIITLFSICASYSAYAKPVFDDSPVLPGTKIIAGDSNQNELYIVAENDLPQLKKIINEMEKRLAAKKDKTMVHVAQQDKLIINAPVKTNSNKKIEIAIKSSLAHLDHRVIPQNKVNKTVHIAKTDTTKEKEKAVKYANKTSKVNPKKIADSKPKKTLTVKTIYLDLNKKHQA